MTNGIRTGKNVVPRYSQAVGCAGKAPGPIGEPETLHRSSQDRAGLAPLGSVRAVEGASPTIWLSLELLGASVALRDGGLSVREPHQ
jgi:hypothetical protein